MELNLMVDIDDVLFPLAPALHQVALELGLHDGTEEALRVWHGWKQYGCTKERWNDVFEALHAQDYYRTAQPVEGSLEALRELYWQGHRINLVTARGFMGRADEIRQWTAEWVEEYAVPHHTLTFARSKVEAQATLGRFDFAIDDGIHNFEALHADGVRVYLQDQPHNAADEVCWAPIGERVHSVREWADIIQEAA